MAHENIVYIKMNINKIVDILIFDIKVNVICHIIENFWPNYKERNSYIMFIILYISILQILTNFILMGYFFMCRGTTVELYFFLCLQYLIIV